MAGDTEIGSHCGSCRGGYRDCDEQTVSEAMLWRARYPDVMAVKTLMDEVRGFYETNLTQFKDNLGLTIDRIDCDVQ